ncbi:MAG: glycosyltransferase family 4 protein [Chloroflexi bacterium]|nr:glycosyltransferase family 4 protein [Chloroflexota bacterium]
MRIAMIGPFGLAPKGTMRVRALPLARELAARGHAVRVIMPPWHTPQEPARIWEEAGVSLQYIPLGPRIPLLSYAVIALRLVRAALAWQPDAIHCFKPKAYSGLAGWIIWHLQRLGAYRGRLVIDEDDWEGPGGWNDLEPYPWWLQAAFAWQERWGLRHCDALTVASRALQSLTWSLGVSPDRVHYMPNGAHLLPQGEGERIRQQYGLGAHPVVLLYTRFFEYDVARAVHVFQRVREQVPAARLLVVGKALFEADDARFDQLVRDAHLEQAVVRAGWVPMSELPAHFAAADVAIYPFDDTLVNRTKCAVKLVDLLAAGMPVVADAVGQNAEYIVHRETGLLVPSGDSEAMAQAVAQLLEDADLRAALGNAARQRMAREFTWDRLAEVAIDAYVKASA